MIFYIWFGIAILTILIGSYFVEKENKLYPNEGEDDQQGRWFGLFAGAFSWPIVVVLGALYLVWFILSAPGRYLANNRK